MTLFPFDAYKHDRNFSMERSLNNKLILVTRPRGQAQDLCDAFNARGAETICQPAIEIRATDRTAQLDEALEQLRGGAFNLIVFASANGVKFALERFAKLNGRRDVGETLARLNLNVAAIGPGTARALKEFHIAPTIMPARYDAEGLLEALRGFYRAPDGITALAFRANRGRDTLAREMRAAGANYSEVEAYQNVDVVVADPATLRALESGRVDAAVATSSASANALVNMLADAARQTRWVALSALTASALEARGVRVAAIAREATMPSLVDAVVELLS